MKHLLMIGGTGVGKSSTVNALTNKKMAKVGHGSEPMTQKLIGYSNSDYVIWDSPGLGEGTNEDQQHINQICKLLDDNPSYKIHHLLLIIEANKRDFGGVYNIVNRIVKPKYEGCTSVLINQADQAMNGQNWNKEKNEPTAELLEFLRNQAISTKDRIKKNTDVLVPIPIFYSASTGYGVLAIHQYLQDLV